MNVLTRILLVVLYPLLILARLFNALFGRDPMRLHEPPEASFWIVRSAQPDGGSYFSEESVAEGREHKGFGPIAGGPLRMLARFYSPPRAVPGEKYSAVADREQGIPDEVYTLW